MTVFPIRLAAVSCGSGSWGCLKQRRSSVAAAGERLRTEPETDERQSKLGILSFRRWNGASPNEKQIRPKALFWGKCFHSYEGAIRWKNASIGRWDYGSRGGKSLGWIGGKVGRSACDVFGCCERGCLLGDMKDASTQPVPPCARRFRCRLSTIRPERNRSLSEMLLGWSAVKFASRGRVRTRFAERALQGSRNSIFDGRYRTHWL